MFTAKVRVSGRLIDVKISARNSRDAKALLEVQYGAGSVSQGPYEQR